VIVTTRRVQDRIEELFALAPSPNSGADRPAFSQREAEATLLVAQWAEEAGLQPAIDPFGNLWCLPPGDRPFVTSGSHVDTVPDGGRLDGPLGTVLGVEAAESVRGQSGLLICAAEEAARFGAGTIGSRCMTGKLSDSDLAEMRDANGRDALTAREEYLQALDTLPRLERSPLDRVLAHVEIHIEQRTDLQRDGCSIGIATTIAGPVRHRLHFIGEVAHAGETPATERRDALCAAAETTLLAERLCKGYAPHTTATVGTLRLAPNALTSIPGTAELGVDIRSTKPGEAKRLLEELLAGAHDAADSRDVTLSERSLSASEPTVMDEEMVRAVEEACKETGASCRRVVSFAGHDAQHVAAAVPAALLFVASENGVSHAPGEAADWHDVEAALAVLTTLMRDLQATRRHQ